MMVLLINTNESYALKVTKKIYVLLSNVVYISSKSTTTFSDVGCDWQVKI